MLVIKKDLFCDHCGKHYGELDHLQGYMLRGMSKNDGWVNLEAKDYCPNCKPGKKDIKTSQVQESFGF